MSELNPLLSLQTQWPARLLRRLLESMPGLLPLLPVAYLYFFQNPNRLFEDYDIHELAIALALLESTLISYASWRCYVQSGEVFLKWLTLGFIGFTVVYSLHGLFTPLAREHAWLFELYGPAARLLMASCLLLALLKSDKPADPAESRENARYWTTSFMLFVAVNLAVALLAQVSLAPGLRIGAEICAITLCIIGRISVTLRGFPSPFLIYFRLALSWFVISSVAFLLAAPWNHLWWLAHGILAGGFSILGYGVLRAFLSSQSFERVFRENELFEDLAQTNARLQDTMERLRDTNRQLEGQVQTSEIAREQFAALFKVSPDGIVVVETDGRVVQANPRAEQMFAYPAGGLTGLQVEELIPHGLRTQHARARQLYKYAPEVRPMGAPNATLGCLRRDGKHFRAAISISGLVFEGRQCGVTFIRDVSYLLESDERRLEADRVAIERGQLLEEVVALVPGLVFQFLRTPAGHYEIPFMSLKALEVLDLDAEEIMQKGSKQWFSRVHPADLPTLITAIERAAVGQSPWQAPWRAVLPSRGVQPFWVQTGIPVPQPDGGLLWTGYLRCVQERKEDALEGAG